MFVNRRTGGITLAQRPNAALSAFIVLSIARWFNIPKCTTETTLRPLAVVALVVGQLMS
jgi:hypothetical protein